MILPLTLEARITISFAFSKERNIRNARDTMVSSVGFCQINSVMPEGEVVIGGDNLTSPGWNRIN